MSIKPNKNNVFIALFLFILGLALLKLNYNCIIRKIFKVPCPGCGMTRAIKAIFQLDFQKAFYYHPMVYFMPLIIFMIIFYDKFSEKFRKISLIITLVLFIVVYIIRLSQGLIF